MNSKRRLDKIEKSIQIQDLSGKQFVGRYYDELSPDERYMWLKYRDSLIAPNSKVNVEVFEDVQLAVCGDLHFICEERHKPPTEAEFKERVAEVEQWMQEKQEEYRRCKADG